MTAELFRRPVAGSATYRKSVFVFRLEARRTVVPESWYPVTDPPSKVAVVEDEEVEDEEVEDEEVEDEEVEDEEVEDEEEGEVEDEDEGEVEDENATASLISSYHLVSLRYLIFEIEANEFIKLYLQ